MKIDYTALYNQYYKRLYQTVYNMIKDHFLAEDIVQETFLKALGKMDTILDENKIGAWLTTIAKRKTIDVIRKENRHRCEELIDIDVSGRAESSTEQEVEWEIFKGEIETEISMLRKEQRQIIDLKINNNLKEKEIASFLNMKQGTVKINMFRARNILKEKLRMNIHTAS